MKTLVTGAAGFIGHALVGKLVALGYDVVGLDNINDYYDPELKYARLADLGIGRSQLSEGVTIGSSTKPAFRFVKMDLTDRDGLGRLFESETFDYVVNLAGQPGVRYSIQNPYAYIESNVVGFLNVLENCRHHQVRHLVYASSSSVYGKGEHFPYAETDNTDSPVSLYAATKKSNELMAYAYSNLYHIPATGVRFFTVYGPWGRPDMAPFLFLRSILRGEPIRVFNGGDMKRDFTYVDDIVEGVSRLLPHPQVSDIPHYVYNIGHSEPVCLMDFISTIESVAGKKAIMKMEGMQPGDVYCTYADTSRLERDFHYRPAVTIQDGVKRFYDWAMAHPQFVFADKQ